jgi:glutathione synthase/RimK-type ligase-like ATP-grasp enzyme
VTVLILSTAPDVHAQAVMGALAARGAHAELLDLSEFPTQLALSIAFEDGRRRFELRRRGGEVLDFDTVRSVWWRRPQRFKPPAGMDPVHQRFAASEATTAFQGLYQSLDANWVNIPARDAVAAHKPYQLALAQEIGLEIPPTLMTNNVEEARTFWRQHEGEVIYKQFIAMDDTWRETRRLKPREEVHASAIAHAPVIFQKHVSAVADLRVTAVGGEFFAAATDVRNADYPQDVRMNLEAKYTAHKLPAETIAKLNALMDRLDLVYGAIDLRLTPEGTYVFLEINPAGQFLYIEKATGQPIAAALANVLVKRPGRDLPRPFGSQAVSEPHGKAVNGVPTAD